MARMMYGHKWSDGTWRDTPEPQPQYLSVRPQPQPKPRKPWIPRGFFKDGKPMSRHEAAMRASNARQWLETLLYNGPKPAKEVLRLARLDGVPESGLRRAKYHHKVKSVKRGGRQHGWGAVWYWQFPAE